MQEDEEDLVNSPLRPSDWYYTYGYNSNNNTEHKAKIMNRCKESTFVTGLKKN